MNIKELRQMIREELEGTINLSNANKDKWKINWALTHKMKCDIKLPHAIYKNLKNPDYLLSIIVHQNDTATIEILKVTGKNLTETLDSKKFSSMKDCVLAARKITKQNVVELGVRKWGFYF